MSKVGLVLGGGGITGAAYHFGALFSLRMATGWDPDDAEVVIGTSSGSFVAAVVRGGELSLHTLVGDAHDRHQMAADMGDSLFRRARPGGVVRWMRSGLRPRLARPDLNIALGSPAVYSTDGIVEWVENAVGDLADSWPDKPTVVVGYDIRERERVPFGTDAAPDVALKHAVAASSAVPLVFEPVDIDGVMYADGGLASGTNADLVLGSPEPLDLVIVIAPLAAAQTRRGARFYEGIFDRAGRSALAGEVEMIRDSWPDTDVLVFRPDDRVLEATRPNPFSVRAAIPAFLRTLRSFRDELSEPEVWQVLERHLGVTDAVA
ncbi:MAG: patatin-like phospholipase family protein [Acidimicrobiia bacterium]|nr:patatin-like phospholipase family protein [Acidimicrobiia bacterium]